jgi:hypothetical protein
VKKRQRRLGDVDEIVLSLYAKGLTTGEISAHFAEIYGASVSKETISRITDAVVAEMQDYQRIQGELLNREGTRKAIRRLRAPGRAWSTTAAPGGFQTRPLRLFRGFRLRVRTR